MRIETLYYDGACPLCRNEIKQLTKLADNNIAFQDVHSLVLDPVEVETRLKILHLETAEGLILKGLDANVAAWQHTRLGFLFRILRWPLVRQFADVVYNYWAHRRFERLYPEGFTRASTATGEALITAQPQPTLPSSSLKDL
jgi:predicted DCC family thiol-disulfide oxidoreductase YuxK